jgi:predicted phosphodiesterase
MNRVQLFPNINKEVYIVGDVHGKFGFLENIVNQLGRENLYLQVGDMAVGMPKANCPEDFNNLYFIRGNHDSPGACKNHKKYLGDFGYIEDLDIYFIGGGYSRDYKQRIPGYDWWTEEELTTESFHEIQQNLIEIQPSIIISHDAPFYIIKRMFSYPDYHKNRTVHNLENTWLKYKPKAWIFGHHHASKQDIIDKTLFICLQELEVINLNKVKKFIHE